MILLFAYPKYLKMLAWKDLKESIDQFLRKKLPDKFTALIKFNLKNIFK